jgi:uncharacterized OB-fold protein
MSDRFGLAPLPEDLVPGTDATLEPWWAATREHRFVVQSCSACGEAQHYPRALCSHCGAGSESLTFIDASGTATIESFTEVYRAPHPAFAVPYVIGLVRLAEGPVLLTRLVGETEWECDQPVSIEWWPVGDGRHLPVFRGVS